MDMFLKMCSSEYNKPMPVSIHILSVLPYAFGGRRMPNNTGIPRKSIGIIMRYRFMLHLIGRCLDSISPPLSTELTTENSMIWAGGEHARLVVPLCPRSATFRSYHERCPCRGGAGRTCGGIMKKKNHTALRPLRRARVVQCTIICLTKHGSADSLKQR
jgi:hypothetical protein